MGAKCAKRNELKGKQRKPLRETKADVDADDDADVVANMLPVESLQWWSKRWVSSKYVNNAKRTTYG